MPNKSERSLTFFKAYYVKNRIGVRRSLSTYLIWAESFYPQILSLKCLNH
ncbi:MAG: hypothetical protein PUP91_25500 [Rhizonema sp. PD37]|nr:hypothetical protein [Rhizonema sp. PD37]